jgi:hypothetical protein
MWRLFSSLMARLTRFAKRTSWSFEGRSLTLPLRLSMRDRRSPVSRCSASDRVSVSDRLSIPILLSASDFVSSSAMALSRLILSMN